MTRLVLGAIVSLCLGLAPSTSLAQSVQTLWPLVDSRGDGSDFYSLHLLGPLLKYQRQNERREFALRPLFYYSATADGSSELDILYPVAVHRDDGTTQSTRVLQLLNLEQGEATEYGLHKRSFYLFPFLFYGEHAEHGRYAALFPLGGSLHGWFGRDRIRFTLFPFYSRTEKGERRVENVFWPFFARISGPQESGFKVWPLYGQTEQPEREKRTFFLWPLGFTETRWSPSGAAERQGGFLPFFYWRESVDESYRSLLWPFFNFKEDRRRDYREWNFPWPLVRTLRGETRFGNRFLPLYADETLEQVRRRWYLWPVVNIDSLQSDLVERSETRLLYFLYRDLAERVPDTGAQRRRILCWPLFGLQQENGLSHLHALALLEPLLPDNENIVRLWAPLWRVYQQKWDRQGTSIGSLLWNLVWWERRDDALAWEVFPLVDYRRCGDRLDLRFLKGLFGYRADGGARQLRLFFLPWTMTGTDCTD
ncbi:MAG: hypothetical protein RQ723_09915 [Desulfuromonadales bacterium]|nr:hypothetical protein [Desulfuromonadales bacterium]